MVADIFKEMTAEGGRFYEMQKKQSESLYGVYENLKDNIQNAFDEIGQSNRGLLMGIGKLATFGAKHLDILSKAILPLVVGMGAYRLATKMALKGTSGLAISTNLLAKAEQRLAIINAQGNAERGRIYKLMIQARIANDKYTISVLKAAGATNVFSRAWYTLKAAIIANPIGAIITAVTALYSAITYVFDALGSAEKAHKRVTESIKETKEELNAKFNLKGYDDLAKKLREQENLVKSAKMSYRDFAKVYPELAEQYKTQEDRLKALNNVEKERQDIISEIKSNYPEYFSYLKEETSTVADLSKGYDALATKMREVQLERLKEQKQEAQKNIDWWTSVGESWYASSIDKS
jgi:Flp pilus assembly pilin Flp